MTKSRLIYLISALCCLGLLLAGSRLASQNLSVLRRQDDTTAKARVTEVLHTTGEAGEKRVLFAARITAGPHRGEEVYAMQTYDPLLNSPMKEAAPGDRVILMPIPDSDTGIDWYLSEYIRSDALLVLGLLFAVALALFGRGQGLRTLLSLGFTCGAVFGVMIPAILSGRNIYLWSSLTCLYITASTLLLVHGPGRKSLAAGLGCAGGVAVAAALTLIMDRVLHLTGMVDEDSFYLLYLNETPLDLRAIIFAAILVGAIGAILDVSMDVAAALSELSLHGQNPTLWSLARSGMTIGRDIVGTMASTLVLAYIGSSLSVVLLLIAYTSSAFQLLNREMIVVEILQALVGSFGILAAIPCTSLAAGWLLGRGQK